MTTIDCRGMACPAPVISVKKALLQGGGLRVLLDDGAPRENVTRFAVSKGFLVSEQRDGEAWELTIQSPGSAPADTAPSLSAVSGATLLIASDRLGDGPDELGRLLMRNMIHTLLESDTLPEKLLFLNSGVLLTCEGSPVLEALERLTALGVEIRSCGLCLDFFNRKEELRAGGTTNMLATVDALLADSRVIKL